jgi:uncharacterized repeat protein (TIGR04138 family)
MQSVNFEEVVEKILKRDSRYHRDAYFFLREALTFTQKAVGKAQKGEGRGGKSEMTNHVTPRELLGGIREYTLTQFGPMAPTVLEEWGIHATEDFGEMVFNMIEHSLLAKTDTDSRDDFKGGYDFAEVFTKPFVPSDKATPETKPVL